MSRESLGHFELLVLLALLRQGDEAYGVPIARAIEHSTGKPVILASVYNTLERLEQKGLVRSTIGQPTPERGGRAERYFSMTTAGLREVRAAKKALTVLWRGVPVELDLGAPADERTLSALRHGRGVISAQPTPTGARVDIEERAALPPLVAALVQMEVPVFGAVPRPPTVEEIYFAIQEATE